MSEYPHLSAALRDVPSPSHTDTTTLPLPGMAHLTAPQPPPTYDATKPPCWELVIADVERIAVSPSCSPFARHNTPRLVEDAAHRDAHGRNHYGVPLQPHNGRDALIDAYQEMLDGVVYLRQRLAEVGFDAEAYWRGEALAEGTAPLYFLYRDQLDLALRLRAMLFNRDGK